jgi:hypothetical protein
MWEKRIGRNDRLRSSLVGLARSGERPLSAPRRPSACRLEPAHIAGEGDAFTAITAGDVHLVPGSSMATDPDRAGAYQNHTGCGH